jgi:hypothetical protein
MKYYGNIDLNQNELQHAVIKVDSYFPLEPKIGQMVFKSKVLYICIDIQDGLPFWAPLTKEIDTYIHNQGTAALVWNIQHDLNSGIVHVQAFDSNGAVIIPDEILLVDKDNVRVTFSQAIVGRALCMIGTVTGNERPDYSYEHIQTTLSNTWVVNHGLGHYPTVRVFIGNVEVQPASIVHNTVNTTTITFSSQYVGMAKFV